MEEPPVLSTVEKRVFALICTLFVLAITLPYLWACAHTPQGFTYGGLLFNPDDQNVHLGWARQAHDGAFFFRDNFTHESLTTTEKPLFTNGLLYIVGVLARFTGLPIVLLYHAVRVGFAILALWWFFRLCALVTSDKRIRITALLLAAFGCGAGWLQPLFPAQQLIDRPDLTSAMIVEAFFFASAFVYPLNVVSFACLVTIFSNLLAAQKGDGRWPLLRAGLAAFVLSNIHTYDVIPLNLTLLFWAALQTPRLQARLGNVMESDEALAKPWRPPLIVLLWTLPPLLYQVFVFSHSTEFRIKALTRTRPPHLDDLFLSYIFLVPLAIYGAYLLRGNRRAHLIMLWTAACFVCIFLPLSFGRKMLEGVQMPLSILAAAGLVALVSRLPSRLSRYTMGTLLLALMSLSSAQFVQWCMARAADNNASRLKVFTPPVYIRSPEFDALQYLSASGTERNKALLCMPYLGNYVPSLSNRVVFMGHWAETLHGNRKLHETIRFYQGKMTGTEARIWLHRNSVGLVYTGSYERQTMALTRRPLTGPPVAGLVPLYDRGGVRIDRVPE